MRKVGRKRGALRNGGRVHVQQKEEGRGEAFRTGNRSLNLLQVAARSPRWTTESAGERVGVNSSLRLVDLPALKVDAYATLQRS